jgi:uncharacterized protein
MLKAILRFIAPYTFGTPKEAEPPETTQGIFSTHLFDNDPIEPGKRRARIWESALERISALIPKVDVTGTAMDSWTDSSSVKEAYQLSQPNIPDTLLMWYVSQGFIGHQMCAFLAQHWLINKACTMPARDAIRQGYEIVSADGEDVDQDILQELKKYDERFRLTGNMMEFIRHGRIFGVRILFFKVDSDDPEYYEKPFNFDGVTEGSYKGIVQVDPYWTAPMLDADASARPDSMHFYEPTWWMINGRKYHRTHLIIFRNAEVPDILKPSYIYGGVPIPQQIMERVYAAERTANEGPLLAMTKRTTVFSTNIAQAFANKDQFDQRLAEWIAYRDNQQVKVADKDADKVEQFDTALGDLDNVIMTQYQIVAAAANVPATKLLGTTPKGFNATGEYEAESYHEELESIQTHELNPLAVRHYQLLVRSYIKPKFGTAPAVRIEWNPVDSPTAAEEADIGQKKSATDAAYVEMGAIDGIDVRNKLIADKKSGYSNLPKAMRPDETSEGSMDHAEKKRRSKRRPVNNLELDL